MCIIPTPTGHRARLRGFRRFILDAIQTYSSHYSRTVFPRNESGAKREESGAIQTVSEYESGRMLVEIIMLPRKGR